MSGHNGRVVGKLELVKGMTRDSLIAHITRLSDEGRAVDPHPTANKYPSGATISSGVKALQKLFNLVTGTTKTKQIPGDNFDWLQDVNTVMQVLNAHYTTPNSRTSIKIKITALLSWLEGYDQLLAKYAQHMSESAAVRDEETSNNEMTPKQKARYIACSKRQRQVPVGYQHPVGTEAAGSSFPPFKNIRTRCNGCHTGSQ
jgi:hypothetical protein